MGQLKVERTVFISTQFSGIESTSSKVAILSMERKPLPPNAPSLKRRGYNWTISVRKRIAYLQGLDIQSIGCGLFGDTFATLNGIRFAESNGLIPRVQWKDKSLYCDDGLDVWSRLFEVDNLQEVHRAIAYKPSPFLTDGVTIPGRYGEVQDLIARHCRPKASLNERADQLVPKHSDKPLIGVHYRGTDMVAGFESRKSIRFTDYFEWIDSTLEIQGSELYIATDDQAALDAFTKRYKNVRYQSCTRSEDGNSIHGHYDAGQDFSGLQKAEEALIDAVALSHCRSILHAGSSVAAFAVGLAPQIRDLDLRWIEDVS